MTSASITTRLHDLHLSLGAKLIDFSGYRLPVWYRSAKEEHIAVRTSCGLFDISHMGVIRLTGPMVSTLLETITCTATVKAKRHIMTYSMILNESAGILDDVMMGQVSEDEWLLVVNASNKHKILSWISTHNTMGVGVTLLEPTHSFIAIQGPQAATILDQTLHGEWSKSKRFSVSSASFLGHDGYILRTGYTGEDGFELVVPNEVAPDIFSQCVQNGAIPCGLAARDSLRIEAGLPLYGQELSETLTPLNTRYPWIIDWTGHYIGHNTLISQRDSAPPMGMVGLRCEGNLIPRTGYSILEGGTITSGTLPPNSDHSIALALVPPHLQATGTLLTIQIRGHVMTATVVPLPFGQ